jgi:trk system potassium uptake protein TrkA
MKDFVIIGLGRFGSSVAANLHKFGKTVLGIDPDEDSLNACLPSLSRGVVADASDERILRELNVQNYDAAIVGIGSELGISIMVTEKLKELGVPLVIARATSDDHARCLLKVGADRVIAPERDMGVRVARNIADANILDFIDLDPEVSIQELSVLDDMVGLTLREQDLAGRYGANVIAIKRDDEIVIGPRPDEVLRAGDIIIVILKSVPYKLNCRRGFSVNRITKDFKDKIANPCFSRKR